MENTNSKLTPDKAWNLAVELLARRNHTSRELHDKLVRRGYDDRIVAEVVSRCRQRGYLDDAESGRLYAEELIRKGYGPNKIRYFLIGKGIDEVMVDDIFREKALEEKQLQMAKAVLEKKLSGLSGGNRKGDLRAKLYRFMIYRGFSAQVARELLRDW